MMDLNTLFIETFVREALDELSTNELPNGRILDLGCGQRPYRMFYIHRFSHVVAADFDIRSSIDIQVSAERLPFCNGSIDVVLLTEVIEHLPNPTQAMSEIARVLSPGGVLLLTWPFCYGLHELPNDYTRFTEFGMAVLLQRSGLEIQKIRRRGDVFAVLWVIVSQVVGNALEAIRRIPLLGLLMAPVTRFLDWVVGWLSFPVYLGMRRAKRLNPLRPGENLRGVGHLAQWTLGYCVCARLNTKKDEA
jgi:SAM-dependent methyltransferase